MTTLYYEHPDFLTHYTGLGHPESLERLKRINAVLAAPEFERLVRMAPPLATTEQVSLIHSIRHIENIRSHLPVEGLRQLDGDTLLSPGSLSAALRAVGAGCNAVDQLLARKAKNAFCAVRPPGHHAEPDHAMGFCLFNNIAIAAAYARKQYGLDRVAIVDFDVHHGNGTQVAFYKQPQVMYVSSHEVPHYPGTGYPNEVGVGNIINVPLKAGDDGAVVRKKYQDIILPALNHFKPQLLFISAGFDAHKNDPLGDINLVEEDFAWLTQQLMTVADQHAEGRVISMLEGGYHLKSLAASVAIHVQTLLNG